MFIHCSIFLRRLRKWRKCYLSRHARLRISSNDYSLYGIYTLRLRLDKVYRARPPSSAPFGASIFMYSYRTPHIHTPGQHAAAIAYRTFFSNFKYRVVYRRARSDPVYLLVRRQNKAHTNNTHTLAMYKRALSRRMSFIHRTRLAQLVIHIYAPAIAHNIARGPAATCAAMTNTRRRISGPWELFVHTYTHAQADIRVCIYNHKYTIA